MTLRMVLAGTAVFLIAGCQNGSSTEAEVPPPIDTTEIAPESASIGSVSPAEQELIQMEKTEFYATQSLALRIAKQCEALNFDFRRHADIEALRGEGGGGFGLPFRGRSVRARATELDAEFAAKHGVDLAEGDLCAAGQAERTAQSAVSGTLRPVK